MVTNQTALLVATNANDIRDIKPPVEIPSGWEWLWWLLAALIVLALAVWVRRWWQKRRAQVLLVPPKPAHLRAKQQLQEALALITQPKPFVVAVSDTTRYYLEERFNFDAPERTTEEFLHELRRTDLLSADQKASLSDFLQSCDLVKFAKYEPGDGVARTAWSAVRLVEETEPPPAARIGKEIPLLTYCRPQANDLRHRYLLLLLLLLPLAAWLKGRRGQPPAFVYSSLQLLRAVSNVSRARHGGLLAALRWLVLARFIRAGPAAFDEVDSTKTTASGVDIVVAFDLSGSMAAEDFEIRGQRVNRVEMARAVLKGFIYERPNDRIGRCV